MHIKRTNIFDPMNMQLLDYRPPFRVLLACALFLLLVLIPQRLDQSLGLYINEQHYTVRAIAALILLMVFGSVLLNWQKRAMLFSSALVVANLPVFLFSWLAASSWSLGKSAYAVLLYLGPMAIWPIINTYARENASRRYVKKLIKLTILLCYAQGIASIVMGDAIGRKLGWPADEFGITFLRSTLGGPNDMSGFIALTLPVVAIWTIASRGAGSRLLNMGLLMSGGIMIAYSQERAAFIAGFLGIIVALLMSPSKKKIRLYLVVCVCCALILSYIPRYLEASRFRSSWSDVSYGERLNALKDAKDLAFISPLVGSGFGMVYPRGWSDRWFIYGGQLLLVDPHNSYVYALVESGALGLGLLAIILSYICSGAYRHLTFGWRARYSNKDIAGLTGGLISFVIFSLTSSALFVSPAFASCFWMIAGYATRERPRPSEKTIFFAHPVSRETML